MSDPKLPKYVEYRIVRVTVLTFMTKTSLVADGSGGTAPFFAA
jgi:hypothetical protein